MNFHCSIIKWTTHSTLRKNDDIKTCCKNMPALYTMRYIRCDESVRNHFQLLSCHNFLRKFQWQIHILNSVLLKRQNIVNLGLISSKMEMNWPTDWLYRLSQQIKHYCFASKPHMHTHTAKVEGTTTIQLNEQNHKPKIIRLQNRKYGNKTVNILGWWKKPQIKVAILPPKSLCISRKKNVFVPKHH